MATFTPPVVRRTPPTEQTTKGPAKNLFRHFRGDDQADTVWIYTDGTVSTENPQTTYNADGSINVEASLRVRRMFLGGATYTDVSVADAALLTAAGYTVT